MKIAEHPEAASAANERPGHGASIRETSTVSEFPPLGSPPPELDGLALDAQRSQVFDALFSSSHAAGTTTLGRYVVQGTLGRGAMGTVLKAFDPTLDRRVAIKLLHKQLDPRHTVRLHREAQALAKLSHPNVVQVYEVGSVDGQAFVVMERVKGQTLRDWMFQDDRPTWRECIDMFLQIGAGLIAAHDRGLVHRDFKPTNAIVDRKGRPRVLDFGLARQAKDFTETDQTTAQGRRVHDAPSPLDDPLTGEGTVLGTPAYMSPEQMKGIEADPRSDQFSFCVALYEAVYGERPFEGTSMAGLVVSMLRGRMRPAPKGTTVPSRLRSVLVRGLSLEPKERWPSMEVLLSELRRVVTPQPRRWLGLGLAAAVAVLGLGSWQYFATSQCDSDAQLEGLWDDARRRQVSDALPAETREQVVQELDDYAREWAGQYVRACESKFSEHPLGVLGEQFKCVESQQDALQQVVDRLTSGDAAVGDQAPQLVADLPRSPCDE